MKIKCIEVGALSENAYFYYNEETRNAVLIDPGDEPEKLAEFINKNYLNLKAVFLTHAHFDHFAAIPELRKLFDFKIYIHEKEATVLMNASLNLSALYCYNSIEIQPDITLKDDEVFSIEELEFKIVHTPGHTGGSSCYINFADKIVFSGDTLFFKTIGRSDLPTSEPFKIKKSIRNKLFTLNDDFVVYPGHGEQTTIGSEKKYNNEL